MLEDFEGLRRRVLQLYKERSQCDELIQTREMEVLELRDQVEKRDEVVKQVEELNQRNIDEYLRAMQEIKTDKEKNET